MGHLLIVHSLLYRPLRQLVLNPEQVEHAATGFNSFPAPLRHAKVEFRHGVIKGNFKRPNSTRGAHFTA